MANGDTFAPSRLSVGVLISLVTVVAGGFSAWYGMSTRLALVEAYMNGNTTRIDTVASTSDRVDESMNRRIDKIFEDVQQHMRSPAHAMGERIAADFERRITQLEKIVDDMHRDEHGARKR